MRFGDGEIIGYRQMCDHENASLQRGMNYRLNPSHSVVLMSVRAGAPYDDEIQEDDLVSSRSHLKHDKHYVVW